MCLVPQSSCANLLIIHLLRGSREGNRMQKGLRKKREPLLFRAGSAGLAGGCEEPGEPPRGKSWRMQSCFLAAQDPQDGVREPRGHGRNLHDGCKLCKLKQKGCRWVSRLLARVGLPRERLFLPHGIGGCGPSGCSASLTVNFLPIISAAGPREKLGSGTGGREISFGAVPPIYRSRVSFRGSHVCLHPCAARAEGAGEGRW